MQDKIIRRKYFFTSILILALAPVLSSFFSTANREQKRIKPYSSNTKYWQLNGKPVFLLGANLQYNTFQADNMKEYLQELNAAGGNYIRNVMSGRVTGNLTSIKQLPDGTYDLNKWNPAYWKKFRNMLSYCSRRHIIVQITLWDRFDHYDMKTGTGTTNRHWLDSPWNPANNINYTISESRLDSIYASPAWKGKNPFLKTPPTMEDLPKVLYYQQKFIDKVMDISLKYGNVLYNMGNENQAELRAWDHYWCSYIRTYAAKKHKQIETTAMFDKQNFDPVIQHNELYTFVEGSKIGSRWTGKGEQQYSAAIDLIAHTAEVRVRPVNAIKVRTQQVVCNPQARLWRLLMAGFAAISHHMWVDSAYTDDGWPLGGLGNSESALKNLKSMRIFTQLIQTWECIPRQDLLGAREADEAYLLAKEGEMYGLYFPGDSASISLDLTDHRSVFKVWWIDIGNGQLVLESTIKGGKFLQIETPYKAVFGWSCCIVKAHEIH